MIKRMLGLAAVLLLVQGCTLLSFWDLGADVGGRVRARQRLQNDQDEYDKMSGCWEPKTINTPNGPQRWDPPAACKEKGAK